MAMHPWLQRIGWFLLLWVAGVLAVGAVAYVLRLVLIG
ncbi:MAG: DUF2474 family protein [Nitratireductor sp.]|nr:DUF2474 family protein [Nitratireductor sp.]MCB1460399.1 DUF2474 family protein [Nitratireductor sp.]